MAYNAKDVTHDDLTVAFDIFWSRLSVMQNSELKPDTRLRQLIDAAELHLIEIEDQVFDKDALTTQNLLDFSHEYRDLAFEIREIWVADFLSNQEQLFALTRLDAFTNRLRFDLVLVAFGLLLPAYLGTELFLSVRAQKREAALKQAALAASEAKTAFLANISHEIRTPLNGILGMGQALADTQLTSEQTQMLDTINSSGDMLLHTLNDVLDIAKIESGKLQLSPVDFELREVLGRSEALYRPQATDKGLELVCEIDDNLPHYARGDCLRFGQILNNLISNAVKFTLSGSVTLKVQSAAHEDSRSFDVLIDVIDTGVGIPDDKLDTIFAPFSQADAGTTRSFGGTGLGLAIVQELAELLGGAVSVSSTEGKGSTFSVVIPFDPPSEIPQARAHLAAEASTNTQETAEAPLKILIADDSATNRKVLRQFLKPLKCDIEEAEDGLKAQEAAQHTRFDAILMDVQMPVCDGAEATQKIREWEEDAGLDRTFIAGVTANVLPHQVQDYHDKGMDIVLAKPVKKGALLEVVTNPPKKVA